MEDDLFAILLWASALWYLGLDGRHETYGVGAHPSNQLTRRVVQSINHLAIIIIIGISEEDELLLLANVFE